MPKKREHERDFRRSIDASRCPTVDDLAELIAHDRADTLRTMTHGAGYYGLGDRFQPPAAPKEAPRRIFAFNAFVSGRLSHPTVVTKRCEAARKNTAVLDFQHGEKQSA